jgi:hypothetical protein
MLTLYNRKEPLVPEPLDFRPIDLRALKRSYETDDDYWSRPTDRQEPLVMQVAS